MPRARGDVSKRIKHGDRLAVEAKHVEAQQTGGQQLRQRLAMRRQDGGVGQHAALTRLLPTRGVKADQQFEALRPVVGACRSERKRSVADGGIAKVADLGSHLVRQIGDGNGRATRAGLAGIGRDGHATGRRDSHIFDRRA